MVKIKGGMEEKGLDIKGRWVGKIEGKERGVGEVGREWEGGGSENPSFLHLLLYLLEVTNFRVGVHCGFHNFNFDSMSGQFETGGS